MGVNTDKYIRKPLYVDAVRVTPENFDEIAAWCQGEVQMDASTDVASGDALPSVMAKKYIKVRVHNPKNLRQTQAFVGDWILYTERGYKVYTNKAFRSSFDPVDNVSSSGAVYASTNGSVGVEATLERAPKPMEPTVADSDTAPPQQTEDGRRILTVAEQQEMDQQEITDLIRSGEVVLAQDLV